MIRKSLILLSLAVLPFLSNAQETKENADFKLALNLYNDGFHDLALEQFRQFVSFYPNTQQGIEARYYLGLTQFALKRYDEARLTFQNFALSYADHPRAPEAWEKVAESHREEGNKREAALAYERIRTFHPRSRLASPALEKAATLFDELGDEENAIRLLRVLTQSYASSGLYSANIRLAELYAKNGQPDAAMTEVRKVIEGSQEPRFRGPALLLQAKLMIQRGMTAQARTTLLDIRKNFKNSPAYHDALFELASIASAEGDIGGAQSAWSEITNDRTATPADRQRAYFGIGSVREATMNASGAFSAYDSARSLTGPLTASAAYRAGRIKEIVGDTISAARLFAEAAVDTAAGAERPARLVAGIKAGIWMGRMDLVSGYAGQIADEFGSDPVVPGALMLWAHAELTTRKDASRADQAYRLVIQHPAGAVLEDDALLGMARSQAALGYPDRAVELYEELLRTFPASDVRDVAAAELARMRTYTIKDRDAGTEQLAYLLGDVIGEQSPSMLAFRLAEISFLQLKNFTLARDQYRKALDGGLLPENRPAAWLHLGRSLLYLSVTGSSTVGTGRTGEARSAFETILRDHPEHPLAQEAFLEVARLQSAGAADPAELDPIAARADSLRFGGRSSSRVLSVLARRAADLGSLDRAIRWSGRALEGTLSDAERGELLWRTGVLLARSGSSDTAIVLLTRSFHDHGIHPAVASAGTELARLESRKGNVAAVLRIVDRLRGSFAYAVDRRGLLLTVADADFESGSYREALDAYDQYVASVRNDPFRPQLPTTPVVYRMARSAQAVGATARALQLYGEVIGRSPEPDVLLASWNAVATLSESMGDLARASSAMDQASRLATEAGGDVTAVSLRSADLLFRNEQYQEALTKYLKIQSEAASDSLRTALEVRIIVCYFRLNNLTEADKRATAFVRANPRASSAAAEFEFERGSHHVRQGRVDRARQRFEIVVKQYPNDPRVPDALFWLGRLYEIGEQPDSAGMVYDSLLRRFPDAEIVPRVELSLGNVYYALEQWDNAARLFNRLLNNRQRAPDLVQYAMNNLILTYKELALFDGALQLTREYIALFPEDPEIINKRIDIGVLYQRLGYYDQSIVHLQDLLLTAPSEFEAELRYYIGEGYYYKGDHQQAILEFLKVPYLVVRQGPIDWIATSYYMAGQSYEKLSRFDQAIAMYQQIIDRRGIDAQFKTAAQREIDRVKALVGRNN